MLSEQIDKFSIGHYSNIDMDQFRDYSCVSDCPDVEKLLHAHLLPILTPAPGNMLISGDCDAHKRDPMLAIAMEISSDPNNNAKVHTSVLFAVMFREPVDYSITVCGKYWRGKTLVNELHV